MTFEQQWAILIKHWKLIMTCFVVVGLGAYIGSKLMTPIYQSAALIQVAIQSGSTQAQYDNLLASDQLVQTEAQIAVSDPVLREVASRHPGLTAEQLAKQVTSTAKLSTQLFEIDVQDPNPVQASALANDIANTLIKQQLQLVQQEDTRSQQQIQQDLQQTQQQINATITQIAKLQAIKGDPAQISILKVQLSNLQQHYSQVQTVLAQLELTEAQNGDFLRIIQPAHPPLKPILPNTILNTGVGLTAGLLLGILLAILVERLDTRVRSAEVVSQLLGWPSLATIWRVSPAKEALIYPQGRDANVEAYRILRTNIGFSALDKPVHSIMVTSAGSGDGKSVIASNLAIFMAKAGKNTLLIDADLRRPTVYEKFGLPAHALGFSNAILAFSIPTAINSPSQQKLYASSTQPESTDTVTLAETILDPFVHAVNIPNLGIMPSGPLPPNPPELLDSKTMQQFFKAVAKSGAEIVIFDAPPLLGLSDASILASKVDGTLVVVDITRANKGSLKQVKGLLTQSGTRVLGHVINKQRRKRKDAVYSYYYSAKKHHSVDNHSAKKANFSSVSSATPDILGQQSQLDLVDGKRGGQYESGA
jgi:Mrp family chromosome partitioning ATPase/capsular polysaccharide biosynthesis protein